MPKAEHNNVALQVYLGYKQKMMAIKNLSALNRLPPFPLRLINLSPRSGALSWLEGDFINLLPLQTTSLGANVW